MKRTFFILTIFLTNLSVTAQDFNHSEYSFNIGVGVSDFRTNPTEGKAFQNSTITTGLNYHFFFNRQWGIGTGVNFTTYNDGITIDDYNKQQTAVNSETGSMFDFHVTMSDYKERHQIVMINIPLMLQFQSKGETAFYAALGGKAVSPFSAKNRAEGIFTSTGYFPNVNVTYENLPEYGFVNNQSFPGHKTNINLKTAFMASAETGVRWRPIEKLIFYTGVYVDYGLNNSLKSIDSDLVVYQSNAPAKFAYNNAANAYARQMKPFTFGITVRIATRKQ